MSTSSEALIPLVALAGADAQLVRIAICAYGEPAPPGEAIAVLGPNLADLVQIKLITRILNAGRVFEADPRQRLGRVAIELHDGNGARPDAVGLSLVGESYALGLAIADITARYNGRPPPIEGLADLPPGNRLIATGKIASTDSRVAVLPVASFDRKLQLLQSALDNGQLRRGDCFVFPAANLQGDAGTAAGIEALRERGLACIPVAELGRDERHQPREEEAVGGPHVDAREQTPDQPELSISCTDPRADVVLRFHAIDKDQVPQPLQAPMSLRCGQCFGISIKANTNAYVYLLHLSSSLEPPVELISTGGTRAAQANRLTTGADFRLPSDAEVYHLDRHTGDEHFIGIASRIELPTLLADVHSVHSEQWRGRIEDGSLRIELLKLLDLLAQDTPAVLTCKLHHRR